MGDSVVFIRIALHVLAGWLYGSGYVGAEVRDILTADPAVAAAVEALVCSAISAASLAWWRIARRLGWRT